MGTKEKKLLDPQEKFVEGVVKHGTKKKPPVRTVPKAAIAYSHILLISLAAPKKPKAWKGRSI